MAVFFDKMKVVRLRFLRKSSRNNSTNGGEMHLKLCLGSKLKFDVFQLFYNQVDMLFGSLKVVKNHLRSGGKASTKYVFCVRSGVNQAGCEQCAV